MTKDELARAKRMPGLKEDITDMRLLLNQAAKGKVTPEAADYMRGLLEEILAKQDAPNLEGWR